jgi:autotransporter-associated beta strand protein
VKIISGEWGYTNAGWNISFQMQADYVQREMLTNISQNMPYAIWYNFQDNNPETSAIGGPNFGLLTHDGAKKPSYYAMQAMNLNLKDFNYAGKWSMPDPNRSNDWLLVFHNSQAGRDKFVAWTPMRETSGVATLPYDLGTTYLNGTPIYLGEVQNRVSGNSWSTTVWTNSTGGGNGGWVNESQAAFSANTTLDVNTPVTVSGLQFTVGDGLFDTSNSTLTNTTGNGKLRIGLGGAAIHVDQSFFASTATINAPLVNENENIPCNPAVCQVRKTGPGTLVLNARNTFTGSLLIAEGSVKANVTDALYGPVVTLLNSNSTGGLQFGSDTEFHIGSLAGDKSFNYGTRILDIGESGVSNDADGLGYAGVLSGTGAIRKYGAGTFLLSNANNFSGAIDVYGGLLAVSNSQALGIGTSAVALHGGGIDIRGCTLSRAVTMDTNPITLANSAWNTTSTLASSLDMRADITIAPTGTLNVSGRLGSATTDTHTATKIGAGTLILSGSADNGYLDLVVNQGIAQLSKASTESIHAADNVTVASGATVQYQGSGDRQVWNSITLNGGTVDFNGQYQTGTSMAITAAGSTIANTSANYSVYTPSSIAVSPISDFSVNVAANSILNIQSSIVCDTAGGTVWPALHKTGAGNLMLEGSENNTDLTLFVEGGLVAFNRPSSPTVHTATAAAVSPGAKLQYATYGGDYQMNPGHWIHLWGGTLDLYGANQIGTNFSVATAGSTLANGLANTNSVYTPNNFNYQQSFTVNTVGNLEINGGIIGDNTIWPALTKTGAGTLTLSGSADNTYTTLFASEGTVKLNKTNSTWGLSAATAVAVNSGATVQYTGTGNYQVAPGNWIHLLGGTLDLNGRNQDGVAFSTISGYTGSTLANTAAGTTSVLTPTGAALDSALTVHAVGNLEINGAIVGNNVSWPLLTKTGAGTLTLSGTSDNTWTTLIASEGTVKLNKTNSTWGLSAATAVAVNSGATVQYTGTGNYQVAPGNWIHLLGGTLDLNGRNQDGIAFSSISGYTGSTLANTAVGTTSVFTPSGATLDADLTVHAVGNLTFDGIVTGTGRLTKTGGGTLSLTRANTYSGDTTINNGALRIAAEGSLNASTNGITVNSGGKLLVNSTAPLTRSITINGGAIGGTGRYIGNLTLGNGHLSPGDGGIGTMTQQGNLTMDAGAVFDFDLGSTPGSSDRWAFDGAGCNLTLDGTLNIVASAPVLEGHYILFSGVTSITDNGLEFGSVPMTHNWTYAVKAHAGYYDVVLTAAPEPGAIVLLATALSSLAAYTWRKKRSGK